MHRRVVLLLVAVTLACVDLLHKAFAPAGYHHQRSGFAAMLTTVVVIAIVALVPRFPSSAARTGAAIAVGGALGNLMAVLIWAQGVPDPIVVTAASTGIAFNLADVFVFVGDAIMLSAVVIYAIRNRAVLHSTV